MSFSKIWNEITKEANKMSAAHARFICCPNSHLFQDRTVSLHEPVKIGRSVARCRNSPTNAVFDCKVLSRNHALLWYEDGKFYLQDTKSSNGTFVNNQRLSKASEESEPVEVNSCDIVQFGVDVMDSTRKATHGCIFAEIRLYLPGGEEAKKSTNKWNKSLNEKISHNTIHPTVQSEDLYQLHHYLQEALHREQMLEQKLALLQRVVVSSHDASEKGWQALIDEDKLLSRLEFLENQLQTLSESKSEESLQTTLQQIQEEKYNYENTSKETLRQALQEKLEAVRKLANLERSLSNTEDECTHLRAIHEQTQSELNDLASKHQTKVKEVHELTDKLQDAERNNNEQKSEIETMKNEIKQKLEEVKNEEEQNQKQILELTTDNNRLKELCENEDTETQETSGNILEELLNDTDKLKNLINSGDLKEKFKEKVSEILQIQNKMDSNNDLIEDGEQEIENLKGKLSTAQFDAVENVSEVAQLRQQLAEKEVEMKELLSSATDGLETQLNVALEELEDRNKNSQALNEELRAMEARVNRLEQEKLEEGEMREKIMEEKRGIEDEKERIEKEKREIEENLLKFNEEKERQSQMLTETNKELQAALLARENLLEREETLRKEVESSEQILKTFENSSSSNSDAEDNENDLSGSVYIVMKAKLQELKGELKSCQLQLQESQTENIQLRDQLVQKTNEQILKMENQAQEKVDNAAEVEKFKTDLLDLQNELTEVKCQLTKSHDELSEVKGQHLKVNLELNEANKKISEYEEKIKNLEEELLSEREKLGEIPRLEAELMTSSMMSQARALECDDLQGQLSLVQGQLEEVKQEIISLQDKLLEEQELASKHFKTSEQLEEKIKNQNLEIFQIETREKTALEKLCSVLTQLEGKEEIISSLTEEVDECRHQNKSITSDFDILTQSLHSAEKERGELAEEMRRVGEERRKSREEIEEQMEKYKTLHEKSLEEYSKFETVLGNKDDELAEVTSRCQQLIREREAKTSNLSMRKSFVLGFVAAVFAYFLYYILY